MQKNRGRFTPRALGARMLPKALLSALLSASLVASVNLGPARAASTAFSYQGQLESTGTPVTGLHDFRFRLFGAPSGGSQVGSTVCVDNIEVANGFFALSLDFGQQYNTTESRYLEIEVRGDSGLGCSNGTGFVALDPRQELTAAPLASHALSASTLAAADGSPSAAVVVDDAGKVGIGTTEPDVHLHVKQPGPVMVLQDTSDPSVQAGYLGFWNSTPAETGWVGFGSPGSPHFSIVNARAGGNIVLEELTVTSAGSVGIGTSTPAAKLDVRGNIRLGSTGDHYATGGFENLRLVRGTVYSSGTIAFGTGFVAVRNSVGNYTVGFLTTFSDWATTTVSTMFAGTHAIVFQSGADFATIRTFNDAGTLVDTSFNFIAVGRR